MVTFYSIKDALVSKLSNLGLTSEVFYANLFIAIVLLVVGIFLGKIVKFALRTLFEKIKLEKIIKRSLIDPFLVLVKWSIYVLFINLAIIQLGIPDITNWLTTILGVLPALTGALVIITVGFGIGSYIKKVVEESKIMEGEMLPQVLFYFVIYVFMVFAFKTALILLEDQAIVDILLVVFTAIGGIAFLIYYIKKNNKSCQVYF
ncbi:MAG: hypothetical protein KKE23_01320 [Nanoarchaeota archaeon]|nr:hypothetical protein [Nanoarchaeota archaeon]